MKESNAKLLNIATKIVVKAGKALCDQHKVASAPLSLLARDVKVKGDIISEKIIVQYLQKKSKFSILSEEDRATGNFVHDVYCWLVDPLDGTLNYYQGIPLSCVSVGLWKGLTPVLGAIYDFNRDVIEIARR